MTDALKSLPSAPYHFLLFSAIVWRLYYILPFPSFVIAALALLWLVIRLDRVLKQPVDELIRILGFEVPVAPIVSLLDITTEAISIQWKALERKAETKYAILVNGINIGDVSVLESAVSIKGLAPGICYTVRVVAINSQNFQAASDPLRVQTSRDPNATDDDNQESPRKMPETTPTVVPYKSAHEALIPPLASPSLPKEHRLSVSQKQPNSQRRVSPNMLQDSQDDDARNASGDNPREMVRRMQEKLNELQNDTRELHQQDEEDERQYNSERQCLIERRDSMRQELKDKEDESRELKKVVNQLERKAVAVQQRKANQERVLDSKKNERRRLKDDMERWSQGVARFKELMKSLEEQKAKFEEETQQMLAQAREEREPGLQSMKNLEEQIQQVGRNVKELEDARAGPEAGSPSTEVDQKRYDEDKEFNDKLTTMRMTMQRLWLECDTSRKTIAQLNAKAASLSAPLRRESQANLYDPHMDYASNPDLHNQQRVLPPRSLGPVTSHHFSTAGPDFEPRHAFAMPPQRLPFVHTDSSHSDTFLQERATQADIDRLTGGALASPSANALLPSDLLGDDIDDINRRTLHHLRPLQDSLGSRPSSTVHSELSVLPGLGNVPNTGSSAAVNYAPQSPESPSPSLTSSPHESISAFHQQRLSEGQLDSDRRSIRSTSSSSRMVPGRSRFLGDMFGRQRGKTNVDEGPALGTLKPMKTRSLPRGSDGDPNSPEMSKRGSSGSFLNSMGNSLLGRRPQRHAFSTDETPHLQDESSAPPIPGPLSRFGGARANPWAATGPDSRPTSLYSGEHAFPHPLSSDAPFGWAANGSGSLIQPLDRSNTTSSNRVRSPWSPVTSRRGSLQVDPSASFGELATYNDGAAKTPDAAQAPIGTKPSRFMALRKSPSAARARSPESPPTSGRDRESGFKSMFGVGGGKKRSSSKPSSKKSHAEASISSLEPDKLLSDRRTSTDLASLSATTASTDDFHASPQTAASDGPMMSGSVPKEGRESLMRKLTRKSSYIPGLMSRRSTTAPSTPALGPDRDRDHSDDEHREPASAGLLARTPSSVASAASPKVSYDAGERDEQIREKEKRAKRGSTFSLRGFKRRKERDAPSVSEASFTSDAAEDEGEDGAPSTRASLSVDGERE